MALAMPSCFSRRESSRRRDAELELDAGKVAADADRLFRRRRSPLASAAARGDVLRNRLEILVGAEGMGRAEAGGGGGEEEGVVGGGGGAAAGEGDDEVEVRVGAVVVGVRCGGGGGCPDGGEVEVEEGAVVLAVPRAGVRSSSSSSNGGDGTRAAPRRQEAEDVHGWEVGRQGWAWVGFKPGAPRGRR
uniref:Uncharacterized protein n=1 Tax=Oryza brachyantha TaxID=4533 RepID=J3MA62_ORYBR